VSYLEFIDISKTYNKINIHESEMKLLWKTPFYLKLIFIALILFPSFFVVIFLLVLLNLNHIRVLGNAFLISVSNYFASKRFNSFIIDIKNDKSVFYFHASFITSFFIGSMIFTQMNFLSKSLASLVDLINLVILNDNTGKITDLAYVFYPLLMTIIILDLYMFYQVIFTESMYLDYVISKLIFSLNIIFLPISLSKDLPFKDIKKAEVRISKTRLGLFYTFFVFDARKNIFIKICHDQQKVVYKNIFLILKCISIPIEEKKLDIVGALRKNTFITLGTILNKYPEFNLDQTN
jgi:hypothetical protein